MIITTTPNIEGKTINSYIGVVTGEALVAPETVQDIFLSGVTDIVGTSGLANGQDLTRACQVALDEMTIQAGDLGANALVGVSLTYETVYGNMLMVCASGTAVEIT